MAIPARIKPNTNRGLGVSDLLIHEVELQPENNRRDPEVTAFSVLVPTVAMLEDGKIAGLRRARGPRARRRRSRRAVPTFAPLQCET
jgi:hypothetical protein